MFLMTNTHIPISSNDIPSDVVYTPGVGDAAVQGGTQTTDASGNIYAPEVVDLSSTGEQTLSIVAGKTTDTVVKATPGRLGRILVWATGTNAMMIWDNATGHTGTIIGAVPASAPLGPVESGFPASNGITVQGNAANPGVTISFV